MTLVNPLSPVSPPAKASRRSFEQLLAAFDSVADGSRHLLSRAVRKFESGGEEYFIPRYLWSGPPGGGDTFRLGLFATLNGDEPEGSFALTRFLSALEKEPELARGYVLFIYPLCNPTGFEDNSRLSRDGHALNRLFWTESEAPEVRFLESEIWMQAFHGIINLRSDADSAGIYGFASGAVLSQNLLEPALHAAETFLPRNRKRQIEGIPARRGLVYADIYNAREGALRAVPGLDHPPFEITLATPRAASVHLQVEAYHTALTAILAEFRYLQAIGQNI
ncbi:MAG: succinylglutamate desuccinylase/aspartoacylase family protein [Verrucomicrobiales bacterium]|nr:succinylglutamate desuccinylase/aspartoacylase family protein [Verrucomicrobiales bacterium]